ncbi:MAG: SpaA isopeptide-forming pilin-related protein [bacterium]
MKNLKIKVILLLSLILNLNNVQAYEMYTNEYVDNIYYEGVSKDNYFSYQYNKYYIGNKSVYCIEPGVYITENMYYSTEDLSISNLSDDVLEKIFLYAYYGYGYKDNDSINHRIATQTLIWEEVSDYKMNFSSGINGSGKTLNFDKEINSIINLVNNHYVLPSFANSSLEINVGDKIELIDTNEVLSNYKLSYNNDNVSVNENVLSISTTDPGEYSVQFELNIDTNENKIIFYNNDSQKMISRSVVDPIYFTINVKVIGGEVSVIKYGEEIYYHDDTFDYQNILLDNVLFGLYAGSSIYYNNEILYNEGDLIEQAFTDINGYLNFKDLCLGSYYILELNNPHSYYNDSYEKYFFDVKPDDISLDLEIFNTLFKSEFIFTKIDEDTKVGIPETLIYIYNEDNQLIFSGYTDENGEIIINNLPVGLYYIIEKEAAEGYINDSEIIYFDITLDNDTVSLDMSNKLQINNVPNTYLNSFFLCNVYTLFICLIGLYLKN